MKVWVVGRQYGSRYAEKFAFRLPSLHISADLRQQEGYAAKFNVTDDAGDDQGADDKPEDPMQGLEGLDVAGPRQQ